ncbi:MAG: hypothetical protein EXR79_10610, partial [Myxococcales bacterium]|nr:hypothetical protein [Myxococcales bacterium]
YKDLVGQPPQADLSAYAKKDAFHSVAFSGNYSELKGGPDLKPYVLKTDLPAVAQTGAYKDLTAIPPHAVLGKSCGTGLVIKGFAADGSYECVKSMDPNDLPADGIDEISNKLIFNQFVDSVAGKTNIPILDNNPGGSLDAIDFPDIGIAQKLTIVVDIANSNVAKLAVYIEDPNKQSYTLYAGASAGGTLVTSYPDPTKPVSGDLLSWLGKNPKGKWTLKVVDSEFMNNAADGAINKWSINLQTLSNKKIQVKGDLIVDGTLQVGGTTGGISGPVTFKDFVSYENSWCPAQPNGDRSMVLGGICTPGVGSSRDWPSAIAYCHAKKADVCSGSQSLVLRRLGALGNYTSWSNWTNSYADNDSGLWHEAVGPMGDDHSTGASGMAPCCYNVTPKRSTDQIVKINPSDVGIRAVFIHNVADVTFGYAATYCATLNADLCNRSEMVTLRTAGKISANFFWANSADDTDGQSDFGAAGSGATTPNNVNFDDHQGAFACCAQGGDRTTLACPAGSTDQSGVCVTKVNNSGNIFVNAAKDCATTGGHLCTVSQNYKLRSVGFITGGGTWSSNMEDCDGASSSCGNGSVGDDLNPNATFTYACCL